MAKKIGLIILCLMLLGTAARAADIYVDAVLGDNTRTTAEAQNPATPWKCLTVAATGAAVGDTVHVAPGYYLAATGEAFPITITGRYFISTETGLATIDAKTTNVNTINLGASATLEGFTVVNGAGTNWYANVYISAADVQVRYCTIRQNSGAAENKAIYVAAAGDRASIEANTITNHVYNTAYVIGLVNGADNPIIRNNTINGLAGQIEGIVFEGASVSPTIEGNTITVGYNGIYLTGTITNQNILNNKIIAVGTNNNYGFCVSGAAATAITGTITGNEFRGWSNSAGSSGIRIDNTNANYTINKNTLVKNTNGVYVTNGTVNIRDNIISAAPRGGALQAGSIGIFRSGGTVTSTYNNLFNNVTNYSGTVGSQANDITSNPRFVSSDGNDYRLYSDSPCKNTASDGGNRGAYEAIESTSSITTESYVDDGGSDVTGDGTLGNPWKTITKGLGSTEGTVYVMQGTYTAGETFPLVIAAGQKLINYLTEVATIDSSTTAIDTVRMANNSTLEGMTVNNSSANYAVRLYGADAQIINNTINQNGSGQAAYFEAEADRCLVEGNAITTGTSGITTLNFVSGADNPIIRNNTLVGQKTSSAYAIYFAGTSSYPTIEGNTITAGDRGIYQTGICTNQNILNNKIIALGSNNNAGIYFQSNSTGTVASNEVRGWSGTSGAGIYVSGSTANLIFNKNTLVKNTYGVQVTNGTVNIQNSIISAAPRGGTIKAGSIGIYRTGGTVTSTYNDLFNNVVNYSGTVGNQSNDITTNPRFVNSDGNDYQLFSDSPCKGTASDGGNRGAYAATETTSGITTESYVDDGGSDVTGDGTLGNPWKTVTKGLGSTEGTVYVRAGTYNAANGNTLPVSLAAGQSLIGYSSEIATVEGNGSNHVVLIGPNATIDNIYLKLTGNYYGVYVGASNVNITRSKIIGNSLGSGIYFDGTITGATPGGSVTTCEVGAVDYGVYLNSITSCGIVTIEGSTLRDYDIWGVYLGQWGQSGANNLVDIRRNIFRNCTGTSTSPGSYGGIYAWLSYAGTVNVINNTFVKNQVGIYAYRASTTLTMNVRNNILSDTPQPDGGPRRSSYGIYKDQALAVNSSYNNVWNHRTNYSGVSAGTGDISSYPRFIDPWNNNFDLYSDSPCIGTGSGGANIGAYEGAGAANSPYRTTSYVNNTTGVDAVTSGESVSNPYKTVTFANKYTLGTINVAASSNKYNSANSETFPIDLGAGGGKRLSGAGSGSVTLEGYGTDTRLAIGTSLTYGLGAYNNTTIEGITLQGMGNNWGAYFYGPNSILQNSTIKGPRAGTGSSGSGVYFDGTYGISSGGTVSTCEITNLDFGINFNGSTTCGNVTIEGNDIHDNYQWGIYHYFWAPTSNANNFIDIKRNLIRNCLNTSTSYGGIYAWTYYVTMNVNRNTIVKNPIGIYAYRYDSYLNLIAKNNIVASEIGGFSVTGSKGILREGGTLTNTYNDVYSNDTNWSGVSSGEGEISADALFVDATNNDYHLTSGSPCDGTGTPAGTDMGAYDYSPTAPTVTLGIPNGGETWGAGTWNNITWSTTNTPTSMNLYYITSEASGWQTIETGVSDTGTYAWLVPNRPTSTAKVSIEAVKAAETALDESAAFFTITAATDYYVNATTGSNTYNGLTSEVSGLNGPWKTITYSTTAAATNSTIHVAAGNYNAALGESFPISLGTNKNYQGAGSTLSTIEGNGSVNVVQTGADITIEGFYVKLVGNYLGINVRGANVDIKNNKIYGDSAGHGIYFEGSIASAQTGGRVTTCEVGYVDYGINFGGSTSCGNVTLEGNTLNNYDNWGVYISLWGQTGNLIDIRRNIFRDCTATSGNNGGVYAWLAQAGTVNVVNNTFVKNLVGVLAYQYSSTLNMIVKNNIFSDTPRLEAGPRKGSIGIYKDQALSFTVSYNNVWNNRTNYSGVSAGTGDISSYPRFVDPWNNNYDLYSDSPCIGAGEGGANIGAYEGAGSAGSPYRTTSYVNNTTGTDSTASGESTASPYQTVTYANKYTTSTVNVAGSTSLYNAANGETFPIDLGAGGGKKLSGAGSSSVTIEGYGTDTRLAPGTTLYYGLGAFTNTTIEGITLQGMSNQAGVYIYGSNPLIQNAVISGPRAGSGSSGNGVYFDGTNGTAAGGWVKNCEIKNLDYGIYLNGNTSCGNVTIEGNDIHDYYGWGIYPYFWAQATANNIIDIKKNLIRNCLTTSGSYGGIYAWLYACTVNVDRNTIVKNPLGIYSYRYSSHTINAKNNIIAAEVGGYAVTGSKGIWLDSGTITSTYNDVYANDTNWSGLSSSESTDISRDVRLVDPANNDFHLLYNSPCIDSGNPATELDPDGSRADMGALYFDETITGTMAVYVKEPNGGNSLTGLIPYNITWYATKEGSAIDHIELYYSTDGGATYPNVVTGNTANTGSYSWPVPNTPTSQARIRVIAVGSLATDESDSDFNILSGDSHGPTVEVTSPVGSELWKGGDTHNITFTATDEGGLKANSLYAWYSTDGGATFPNAITREASITSPFVWSVPNTINSQTVKVRLNIWDAYSNIGTGESAASFTIDSTPPTVAVTSPTGGEKWQGGTGHDLTWTATDNFTLEAAPITLKYSIDSGVSHIDIATGEANSGTYNWPTPSLNTDEARVKIFAQDVCGNIGSGEGTNFIIDIEPPTAPTLLTPPNGSTTNDATTTFTWNAATDNLSGIASYEVIVDTDVSTQDATTSYTVPSALSEGVHTWKVKAKDGAGIWGEYSATWSFTVDITTPEVGSITLRDRTNGSTQYTNELTISLEANGVTGVPVFMRLAQDSGFTQNATAWLAYSVQTEYTLTAGEGLRSVYYKVRDAATNESSAVNQSITVDTVSPGVESILLKDITSGSTLESNSLTVTVEASGVSAEASQMRIAQNASFATNSTGWITYAPTTEYAFTAGEGSRTAYYQVRDIASNESNIVNQSITIDSSGPSAAGIALKDRVYGSTQYANSLTISLEVHDATGSPAQMRTAQDSSFTVNDTGWLTYATTSEYAFTAGEDSRTAYYKMRDAAQNESGTYNASIVIDTVSPSQVTLLTPANNSYTNDTTPTFTWNAATDVTSGVASYEVIIDTTQIATVGAVTTYTTPDAESQGWHNWKVRAKDNAQNWGDYSTTWYLTIETTAPTVSLGQPNGGVTLAATSSYNITWEAADEYGLMTNPVTLYFSSNAGSSWSTIQAGITYVTGEGTYDWTVPNVSSTTCLVSIEVEDQAGNKAYDISDSAFTISNTQPTAAVTYPNGGEYLKGNTSYNFTWVATGEVAPVTINLRYSTNSGSSWTTIATNETNDGTYGWTTPAVDSTTARVSVEAVDGLGRVGTGQSAANFSIDSTTPEVAVVAPNGGERLAGGSSYNIQWTAADAVGLPANPITLRYSTDSGINWAPIATAQPNTPPYAWTVPSINSTTVRVSVEATDQVGYTGTDQSASDFIIDSTAPAVLSVSPTNGATSVALTTQVAVVFSKAMSEEVTQNAFSLSASPPVAGSFSWSGDGKALTFTPAAVLEYNTLYTVGVAATATDLAGNHLAAYSSTFTTAQRGDSEAPHIIIQRVDAQGVANTLKDGDYIPKQPRFKGIITDNLGVSRATIKFYLDDVETAATITEITAIRFEVAYTATSNLEGETVRTHSVKLVASDTAGNSTTKEIKELKVSYESGKVVGPVLTYPTTYNPLTGQPARLAYNLTADQDVMIYMLDISGQNVWTGKYLSGTEGGKAGYNEILFYGRSEISGTFLGNGIYIYKLVAGNRVIGTGRLAIF